MHPDKVKKDDLLTVAMDLAMTHGYNNIKRDEIARVAKVAMGTVNNHLGTMHKIKKLVVRRAIKTGNRTILAQALVARDPLVADIDPDLKASVLVWI